MPLYEYECRRCHHRFERIQKFSDPRIKKCPNCRGGVRKLISAPGIQFKGTGWYVTDYGRKKGSEASSEGSEGKDKDKGSEGSEGKDKDKGSKGSDAGTGSGKAKKSSDKSHSGKSGKD